MNPQDKNLNKLAVIGVAMFFAYALWEQFSPKPAPGAAELAQAHVLLAQKDAASVEDACRLFGAAVREGNKEAAFGLADCIGQSKEGNAVSRRALRYAVLTVAMEAPKGKRDAKAERDALGCTPAEIKEAEKIDVVSVLRGEMSVLDYALSALK